MIRVLPVCLLFAAMLPGQAPEVFLTSHTHSDYAWFDTMARCLDQNVAAVAKAVQLAEGDAEYRYTVESILALREYLARNPEKFATAQKLLRDGRLALGAFYTEPFEVSLGGEGIIRELYYGKRWVKTHLGVDVPIAWQPDVAGHTSQLPQILRKAGIRGLVISAGTDESRGPALFDWTSPDGSSVPTWCSHYGTGDSLGWRESGLKTLDQRMPKYMDGINRNIETFGLPHFGFIPEGMDLALPTGQVLANLREWNRQGRSPRMRYVTTDEVFAAVARETSRRPLPRLSGEMPSVFDTVESQENEGLLLDRRLEGKVLAAEIFAGLAGVLAPAKELSTRFGVGFTSESGFYYPQEDFNRIWEKRLLAYDHNYGGSHGAENDHLKALKIAEADAITGRVLDRAFETIARFIRFGRGPRMVVFNPLSWDRQEVVTWSLPVSGGMVVDAAGKPVPQQAVEPNKVAFRADVPALGYATYYLAEGRAAASPFQADPVRGSFESPLYRVRIDPLKGGIASLFDKRGNRELIRTGSRYALGELVAYEDTAEDINVNLTGRQWLAREHPSSVRVVENGAARLVVEIAGQLLDRSFRRQRITLYPDRARIDFETQIDWEGRENIMLYQAFPLIAGSVPVQYGVPFGAQQYGQELKYAAPGPYTHTLEKFPWRGVRGWVRLNDVTVSSECNYVAFEDLAKSNPETGILVQPMLLRTVHSCGDAQLFYRQKGTHTFRFALEPRADSARAGAELGSPPIPYVPAPGAARAAPSLPDRFSFVQVSPASVQVPVIKRAEDGEGLVLRLVGTDGLATKAEVRFFRPLRRAIQTDILEENQGALETKGGALSLSLSPSAIETVRISLESQ